MTDNNGKSGKSAFFSEQISINSEGGEDEE